MITFLKLLFSALLVWMCYIVITTSIEIWRYSRHPNYFFEWMMWVSYCIFALGSPYGYMGVISPLIILYLLLKLTGIPATEEQSLRSKGEADKAYQRLHSLVPCQTIRFRFYILCL